MIAEANLMPGYLPRLQFNEDSVRGRFYFNLTKDSNYIRKYLHKNYSAPAPKRDSSAPKTKVVYRKPELAEPEKNSLFKRKNPIT